MRILLVIRSLDIGGAERQCRALAIELADRGHIVELCTLGEGGSLRTGLPQLNVQFRQLDHRGPRDLIRTCRRMRALVKSCAPDVIYSFMAVSNIVCALAIPRRMRRRLVWGIRSSAVDGMAFGARVGLAFLVERALSRIPRLVIVNSEAGCRYHVKMGFDPAALRVVENAIDTTTYFFNSESRQKYRNRFQVADAARVIVIVARVDPIKGYETFIEAAAAVAAARPDVHFWSVGGGPAELKDALAARVKVLGLESRFYWHGEIRETREISALLSASDLAVSSSTSEGFPNAVAEYLLCGLRVVGTDAGDTRRIIGDCGESVQVGDARAMGAAILRQLDHVDSRDRIRASFLARFEPSLLLDRHESLLRDVARAAECGDTRERA